MSRILTRALLTLGTLGIAAIPVGLAAGAAWGWGFLAIACAALIGYNAWVLAHLARWLQDPLLPKLPEARGIWDDVLLELHRHERNTARHQKALADVATLFRRAAEAWPDGVVLLDAKDRIEWCNQGAAAHLGLDPRADVRQPIANLVRDPAFAQYLAKYGDPGSSPIQVTLETDAVYAVQIIPYGEAQKLLLTRDVTQAQRMETMRQDFVANVSHELRTPLTVLVGFLETVRDLKLDPQRVRDYIGMMQEQSSRMESIVDDLLTLSLLESTPAPAAEPVALLPLLERLKQDAMVLSGGRHSIVLDAGVTRDLLGSHAELASAFGNLVTNAIRYTAAGGEVRIGWRDGEEGARFWVEDTGVGIAPEHLPRLTERFYRVDRSRSRESGGTGLGLAIVKHALARHDARLEIESTPGKGSRFIARFPARRLVDARAAPAGALRRL